MTKEPRYNNQDTTTKGRAVGFIFAMLMVFVLGASHVRAAGSSISFETANKSIAPGDEALVTAYFDTGDATVNAISATIVVPAPLSIDKIIEAGSSLTLWVDKPHISADGHSLSFAGIVPGGINGKRKLLDLVVKADKVGTAKINAADIQALDQGQVPKPLHVSVAPLSLEVAGREGTTSVSFDDHVPPETFTVTIQSDASAFDGKPFASFTTHDKQTGIARYEAAFSYLFEPDKSAHWVAVESPYLIPPEGYGKIVWIRAVDISGNTTVSRAAGPGYNRNLSILAIIIVILLLCIAYFVRQRHGSLHSSYSQPDGH